MTGRDMDRLAFNLFWLLAGDLAAHPSTLPHGGRWVKDSGKATFRVGDVDMFRTTP